MCEKAYSDILPRFHVTACLGLATPAFRGVTSCPDPRDRLPPQGRDILPLAPLSPSCLPARQKP